MHFNLQRIFKSIRAATTRRIAVFRKSTQTPQMTTTGVRSMILDTAETSALIPEECFLLWMDLWRLPHWQTLISEAFPLIWSLCLMGHSLITQARVCVLELSGYIQRRRLCLPLHQVADVFVLVLPKLIRRLNLLHCFVYMHTRCLTLLLVRLSPWPYLCAFRGLISPVWGMKIEQSNHTFNHTYSSP